MSNAFQVNELDVMDACKEHLNVVVDDHVAAEFLKKIDLAAVEKAALYGDDIDTQTKYAVEEIARQIGEFPEFAIRKTVQNSPFR